jgi:hypothetical protein
MPQAMLQMVAPDGCFKLEAWGEEGRLIEGLNLGRP